jgi:Protein of unknown function (DUF1420)
MTDAPRAFLRLQDVVLAPPLPALLSILMTAGVAYAGWRLAVRLRRGQPDALEAAAGFIVVAGLVGAAVHGLALAQLTTVATLRPIGLALAALGGFAIVRHGRAVARAARDELASLREAPGWERAMVAITAAAALGLAAAALGPVTDADSIRYHLAVPLDWLRHGGAYARADWLPARLVGLGECLDLLGLAAGTDGFGAALQLGGLGVAAVAAAALAPTPRDRRVAWLLVVGCPVAAFLVPSQKPQMLPAAATLVAIVMAARRLDRFDAVSAWLAFGCAAFALGCKLSFLFTAALAIGVGLVAARRSGRLGAALAIAAATVLVGWGPVLARDFVFYGDPISPFLERFERLRALPDAEVLAFADYLRAPHGEHGAAALLRLPLSLLCNVLPGMLTTALGLGTLAFVPALAAKGPARVLLVAALVATVATAAFGQLAPRFFLEPFLWAGAAFAVAPWDRVKRLVVAALLAQGALSAAVALLGGALLARGALTAGARDAVMTRAAAGYAEARWLDELLPRGAVIASPGTFALFTPRPFLIADPALAALPGDEGDDRVRTRARAAGVNTLVSEAVVAKEGPFERMIASCAFPFGPPKRLPITGRTPLERFDYVAQAFTVRACDRPRTRVGR